MLDYSVIATRTCQTMRFAQEGEIQFKTGKLFFKDVHGFPEVFVSSEVAVIPCLNALNVRVAGSAPERSPMKDVEIWQEVKMSRPLRDGQKS